MVKNIFFAALLGIVLVSCTQAPDAQKAETSEAKQVTEASGEALKLSVQGSTFKWVGTKVTGRHEGTVMIKDGELLMKEGNLVGGTFVIDMNSITCTDLKPGEGKEKLEGHLKNEDFFNVQKFPEAKFEITTVSPDTTGGNTHKIEGNLTIIGKTKNISFGAKVNPSDKGLEVSTKFNINRKDWGITYEGKKDDLIRDEIHFDIQLVAVMPS